MLEAAFADEDDEVPSTLAHKHNLKRKTPCMMMTQHPTPDNAILPFADEDDEVPSTLAHKHDLKRMTPQMMTMQHPTPDNAVLPHERACPHQLMCVCSREVVVVGTHQAFAVKAMAKPKP